MNPILLSIMTALPLSFPAPALASPAEPARFACELSRETIEVLAQAPASAKELTARSAKLGVLSQIDCPEAERMFGAHGLDGYCFVSANGRYLFQFYGEPGTAVSGSLLDRRGSFDLCPRSSREP